VDRHRGAKDGALCMLDLYGHALHPGSARGGALSPARLRRAKEGLDRDTRNQHAGEGNIDRTYRGKHLQIQFTVEDEGVFTMPWTATITYGRGSTNWPEVVCAENSAEYLFQQGLRCPTAAKPDF